MSYIVVFLVLLSIISWSQATVRFCCSNLAPGSGIGATQCVSPNNAKCFTNNTNAAGIWVGCYIDDTKTPSSSTCATEWCNCPPNVHKAAGTVAWIFGEMRKIMYPIMGIVFSIIWIGLAFIGGGPVDIILFVVAIIDAVFGILLIFLPVTTYLGLFYVAIAAFTIATTKHSLGGSFGLYSVIILTIIIFFLTGGLTFISYGANYVDNVANYVAGCETNMNIINIDGSYVNLDTHCENWALFTGFCVFLLFLVQPISLLALFFKKSGGGGGGHGNADHAGEHGNAGGHSGGHPGGNTSTPQ